MEHNNQEALLYPLMARKLANSLMVSADNLPEGHELEEVAQRYQAVSDDSTKLYRTLGGVFNELQPIETPKPLRKLAEISKFKLFITTTFDPLMSNALDIERFNGHRQTLVFSYSPNDKQDLPREFDRLNRPTVFHLMGRITRTPYSYAISKQSNREFLASLESRAEDSPNFLLDKLKTKHILALGTYSTDWIKRFLVRHTRSERHVNITLEEPRKQQNGIVFFQHYSGGLRIFQAGNAIDFVEELEHQWNGFNPNPNTKESSVRGAIFVSYAEKDRVTARIIQQALDQSGVDVICERDDALRSDSSDIKLRNVLSECSLFIPICSSKSASVKRRFFEPQWIETIRMCQASNPSQRFVLPVHVDNKKPCSKSIPNELSVFKWYILPEGEPDVEFTEMVIELQRNYRKASYK